MTVNIFHITENRADIAADALVSQGKDRAGFTNKIYPLPTFNAAVIGGPYAYIAQKFMPSVQAEHFADAREIVHFLHEELADQWSFFQSFNEIKRLKEQNGGLQSAAYFVFWMNGPKLECRMMGDPDFEPRPVNRGLWCVPAPEEGSHISEPFGGDAHLLDLAWRAKDANPDRPIGGALTRVTLTAGGMSIARIGDMDERPAPQAQSTKSARKVGRNEPCPCGSGRKAKRCCQA